MKRIRLNIGDIVVTRESAILETILGSCVAVCLWDARRRIGGLNHYLVPAGRGEPERDNLYGRTSVRKLIEQTLSHGSDRHSLQARIFGGGSILKSLEDIFTIGAANVQIAREILKEYGIPVVHDFVGAECGIRIAFQTWDGAVSVTCFDQESAHRYQDFVQQSADNNHAYRFSSTHTTAFFREEQLFRFLQDTAVPELATRKSTLQELRIWSVGCATGEAAYSIAISVGEALQQHYGTTTDNSPFGNWTVRILATDPSSKALDTAMGGTYGSEQLPVQLTETVKSRYFLKGNGIHAGHIRIKPYLQKAVQFRRLNLKVQNYPFKKQFDLIFCHDGLRAFDDSAKQQAFSRLHRHLAPRGYLFLGQPDLVPDSSLFTQVDTAIFRKQ
jgi:chemotaxis methyl-accepting protein methylase/chemotaxis receptor (MCP) glutamine deamidase CheD